ncbi:MAG: TlpA disulfide reductase family protein [Chitinophagaceae bacterium]
MNRLLFVSFLVFAGFVASAQDIPSWKITDLEKYVHESSKPVVISFWATYCIPCLRELPSFEETIQRYKNEGVSMLLVSLDMKEQFPDDIKATILKRKIASNVVWLNETNADYFCPKVDSSWTGALPSTLFINNKNGYHKFFEEALSKENFEKQLKAMIAGKMESR